MFLYLNNGNPLFAVPEVEFKVTLTKNKAAKKCFLVSLIPTKQSTYTAFIFCKFRIR